MSDFATMRAGLVDRGLLDADHRLTPAGDDYTVALIAELRAAPPPAEPERRVRWNYGVAAARAREAARG